MGKVCPTRSYYAMRFKIFAFLFLLIPFVHGQSRAQSVLRGDWLGKFDDLTLVIEMSFDTVSDGHGGHSYIGTWTSPLQAGEIERMGEVSLSGNTLTVSMPSQGARFSATTGGGATPHLEGTWTQQGKTHKLVMCRARAYVGILPTPRDSIRLVFKFAPGPKGSTIATFGSPDQTSRIDATDRVVDSSGTLRFAVPKVGATYGGKRSKDQTSIKGNLDFGGKSQPMDLTYESQPHMLVRPQEPRGPLSYTERDVTFRNDAQAIELSGTLTIPKGGGAAPAVLLVPSAGPFDRDAAIADHKTMLVIADYLTRHGFVTLRVDRRGVGQSHGTLADATVTDLMTDVAAAVRFLRKTREVDPTKIGLLGHGEGGLIASITTAFDSNLHFLVLLSAPGERCDQVYNGQIEESFRLAGFNENALRTQMKLYVDIDSILSHSARLDEGDAPVVQYLTHVRDSLIKLEPAGSKKIEGIKADFVKLQSLLLSPWHKSYVRINPALVFRTVRCPVLAVGGSLDKQIPAKDNIAAIETALHGAKNMQVETKIYPGLNHLLQDAKTGEPREYQRINESISPQVLADVNAWMVAHTKGK